MADHQPSSIYQIHCVDSLKRIIASNFVAVFDLFLNCSGIQTVIVLIFPFLQVQLEYCFENSRAILCTNVTGLSFYSCWWALDFFLGANSNNDTTVAHTFISEILFSLCSDEWKNNQQQQQRIVPNINAIKLKFSSVCKMQTRVQAQ